MLPIVSPCEACPRRYPPVQPSGPCPARVILIGERPGQHETRLGIGFVGPSGQELNDLYLPLAGFHRADCRVTNAVLCGDESNRTPNAGELASCPLHHLREELARTKPEIIILLGASACSLIPGLNLEYMHGIPQLATLLGYTAIVIPMYHPALALHESRWMSVLIEDWQMLRDRLAVQRLPKEPWSPVKRDYQLTDAKGLAEHLGPEDQPVGIDTEDHGGVPWSIQISTAPHHARMIRATDREAVEYLRFWLIRKKIGAVVLHNASHDFHILRKMGVDVDADPSIWLDTQQEAFHLGILPQGLKPLVYRLFNFTMTSWEDVVRPASIESLIEWLVNALDIARNDLSLLEVTRLKTKIREITKKGPLESLIRRILVHTRTESQYNPWERLDEFWSDPANDWMTSHVVSRLGPYPILGIANAPLNRAVEYACSDADWTLRTAMELHGRLTDPHWQIAEGDLDI